MTPKAPATAKGEATRAYLLRTSAEVFARRGYTAATQAELIAASGLTKGAFYFYFESKAELAMAVIREQKQRWLSVVGERVLSAPTAADQLRAVVPAMVELLTDDPGAWSLNRLSRELAQDPALADELTAVTVDWVGFLADIVHRGQQDGSVRPGLDPRSVAEVLVGSFDGIKNLTDALEPGPQATAIFARRLETLLAITELALFTPTGKGQS